MIPPLSLADQVEIAVGNQLRIANQRFELALFELDYATWSEHYIQKPWPRPRATTAREWSMQKRWGRELVDAMIADLEKL